MSSRRLIVRVALALSAAILVQTGYTASAQMPDPTTDALAEPLAPYQGQGECSATAKPGVVAFQRLLMNRYPGSRNLGIVRACHLGSRSEHKEGRAFDWGVRVDRAREAAYARDLIIWLLSTDSNGVRYANARRVGIMYMIWNRRIWSASRPAEGWRTYTGPNPHTDHIHFSFTWPGAYKLTSYWTGKSYGVGSAGGAPDRTFGTTGWTPFAGTRAVRLVTMLQRADGRLLSVMQSQSGAELVLGDIQADGKPGTSFAGKSRLRLPLPADTELRAATLTDDGGLVVAGTTPSTTPPAEPPGEQPPVPERDALLLRVDAEGALDPAFGTGGVRTIDLGGTNEVASVTPMGADLLVAGTATINGVPLVAVARTNRYGTPRSGFGVGGVATTTQGGAVGGTAAMPGPEGTVLAGCRTATTGCVLRLTPAGVLDTTFGTSGVANVTGVTAATVLKAGPVGRLLVAGRTVAGVTTIVRLRADGTRDNAFGRSAAVALPVTGCVGEPTGIVIRPDGGTVLGGALSGCSSRAFVARLLPGDGSLDPRWGKRGVALAVAAGTAPIEQAGAPLQQSTGAILLPVTAGTAPSTDATVTRFTTSGAVPGRVATLTAAPTLVYGNTTSVYGVVRSTADNGRTSGVPVTFFAKARGATTWTEIGRATTDGRGVATLPHRPRKQTSYYVRSAATHKVHAATATPVTLAIRPRLTVPAAKFAVALGARVTLTVSVRTPHAGRTIILQRLVRGQWVNRNAVVLDASGAATVRLRSAGKLSRYYRWVLPKHSDHATGYSRRVLITWS